MFAGLYLTQMCVMWNNANLITLVKASIVGWPWGTKGKYNS